MSHPNSRTYYDKGDLDDYFLAWVPDPSHAFTSTNHMLSTMAGRRLRYAVKKVLMDRGVADPIITIAGLANSYSHYVTTVEEYAGQRYEAASTLYGPHTLAAYIQEFRRLTTDLVEGRDSVSGSPPMDLSSRQLSLIPLAGLDTIGLGRGFGSVAIEPKESYTSGRDTVIVSFRSSNPRNNQRIQDTFLTIEMLDDDDEWVTRYVDGDWCTKYIWKGGISYWESSFAEIHWKIPEDEPRGIYRVCHFGSRRTALGYAAAILTHTPGWLRTNLIGSRAINLIIDGLQLAVSSSETMKSLMRMLSPLESHEFEGCSNPFLVHRGSGPSS